MGIGVSYTGHDGTTRQFTTEGVPPRGSALDNLVRGNGTAGNALSPLSDLMRMSRRPLTPDRRIDKARGTVSLDDADAHPGTLKEKLDAHGSIEVSPRGLRLKGDDSTVNNVLYGRHNGANKFCTLDEIDDPTVKGAVIGEPDDQNRMAATSKDESIEGAYSVKLQSRTEAEVNDETGEVTFWEYTKPVNMTQGRRVGSIGSETKRKICSFFLGSERQYTYAGPRHPFTLVRSKYTDADGKEKYEYWSRCLKWFDTDKGVKYENLGPYSPETRSGAAVSYGTSGITASWIVNMGPWYKWARFCGVYPPGVYGHYPKRPEGRPRKLVFDSKRSAIVDLFEEIDCSPRYNDIANGWTYVGCSDDAVDGRLTFYNYTFSYLVPVKMREVDTGPGEEFDVYPGIHHNGVYKSGRTLLVKKVPQIINEYCRVCVACMVVTREKYDTIDALVSMLNAHGANVKDAMRHDEYDQQVQFFEVYLDGAKIAENVSITSFLGNPEATVQMVLRGEKTEYNAISSTGWVYKQYYSSPDYSVIHPGCITTPEAAFLYPEVYHTTDEICQYAKASDATWPLNRYMIALETARGDSAGFWFRNFGEHVKIRDKTYVVTEDKVIVGKKERNG